MKREATAVWNGTIKEGKGHLYTQSGILDQTPYSYKTRFEDGSGTNPEELIGAAHAGCFTMKLSANLTEKGYEPEELKTRAEITLENGAISKAHLILNANVPGIDQEEFEDLVQDAKVACPVSQLLKAEISLESNLTR